MQNVISLLVFFVLILGVTPLSAQSAGGSSTSSRRQAVRDSIAQRRAAVRERLRPAAPVAEQATPAPATSAILREQNRANVTLPPPAPATSAQYQYYDGYGYGYGGGFYGRRSFRRGYGSYRYFGLGQWGGITGIKFNLDRLEYDLKRQGLSKEAAEAKIEEVKFGMVYVDGSEIAITNRHDGFWNGAIRLAPGPHSVRVELHTGEIFETHVSLGFGEVRHVYIRFEPVRQRQQAEIAPASVQKETY